MESQGRNEPTAGPSALKGRTGAVNKVGGASLILSGLLFFSRYLLDVRTGQPPSDGTEILAWMDREELSISVANEILFFAAVLLVPAVVALYHSLVRTDAVKAIVGCGIIAIVIPVLAMLDIVQGRLVYPIYDIRIHDPAVAEFTVAVFYGGLHAVGLLLGLATIALSLAMRRGFYGSNISYLGLVTGVFDFIGAYPDRIGWELLLLSEVLFLAWFLAVGWTLYRLPATPYAKVARQA